MKNPAAFHVTNEWIKDRVLDLTPDRLAEFCQLRGYNRQKLLNAFPELGWYDNWHKWTLPIRNIDGKCTHVKCWSNVPGRNGAKWTTIGYGHFNKVRQGGEPSGQLFDLAWLLDRPHGNDLWITAGEFDCLMLRQFNWPATTVTVGESASSSVEFFINEFGGLRRASELLSVFTGIVLCYDCDDAGRKGMQRHAILLDKLFERIAEAAEDTEDGDPKDRVLRLPNSFNGVRAVDLTNHPQWQAAGSPSGWDLTDLIKWSSANKGKASVWLRGQVEDCAPGSEAISALVDLPLDQDTGEPTIGEVMIPGLRTISFSELIDAGVQWTKMRGTRNDGWYHMALVANRNGWTMDDLWYAENNDPNDDLGMVPLFDRLTAISRRLWPNKPDMPIAEMRDCFHRAFIDYKIPAFICDDVANVLRLSHYYPFLRYHPIEKWLWWNNKCWLPGESKIADNAMSIGGQIMEEANRLAANNGDPKLIARLRKFAATSRNASRIHSLLSLASKHPLFRSNAAGEMDQWDTGEWLIGTPQGVFDLQSNTMLDSRSSMEAYCSKTTNGIILDWTNLVNSPGDYHDALGLWLQLLEEWQPDDQDRSVLQEIAATCLVGRLQQNIFVFESPGRSGKSKFCEALIHALGDYGTIMRGSVLMSKVTDNAKSAAIAGIDGRRFVRWDELGGGSLDIDMLKELTGEEFISGRGMRENWKTVRNCATYIATTNETPDVSGDIGESLRSRMVIVKWPNTFVTQQKKQTPEYRDDPTVLIENSAIGTLVKNRQVATVILSWAYAGLQRMLERDGIGYHVHITQKNIAAADTMWEESDMVKAYFEQSGLWERNGETVVATQGLCVHMLAWAKTIGNGDWATQLERGERYLGRQLGKHERLGFVRITNCTSALWQASNRRQFAAWRVPYLFVGKVE